jgi:flagellum-specific peptidoglycan hydrolase FlgJ
MTTSLHDSFLRQAAVAARAAGHIFPEYAACEAALESNWGQSRLAREANNLFGQKASVQEQGLGEQGTGTLTLPTQEFLHGHWVTVIAHWARFSDQTACFRARMELLRRLEHGHPAYARALAAATGEVFVQEVSRTWSTDPERAAKVLAIHRQHSASFVPLVLAAQGSERPDGRSATAGA